MDQKQEGEYLQFKNIQNPKKNIIRSQKVNQKSNHLFKTQDSKIKNEIYMTPQKNNNKNTVYSNKIHNTSNSKQKSPRSTCKIISFSTVATQKQKQMQNTGQISLQQKIIHNQTQVIQNDFPSRLTKAKSNVEIINSYSNNNKKIIPPIKFVSNQKNQQKNNKMEVQMKNQNSSKFYEQHLKLLQTLKNYENKIDRLQKELSIKNKRIQDLQTLQLQRTKMQTQRNDFLEPQNKFQHEKYRQSTRRLLKMLQMTEEYKNFAKLSLDDNGITFLNLANKNYKTKIDFQSKQQNKRQQKNQKIHLCTCFKEFIPENYLWVPESIYQFGKQFIKSKLDPNQINSSISRSQYELLLYELNKIWRERQKRVINTITHQKNLQIDKLKRKYNLYQGNKHSLSNTKIQSH